MGQVMPGVGRTRHYCLEDRVAGSAEWSFTMYRFTQSVDSLTPMRDHAAQLSTRFDEENLDLHEEMVSTSIFEEIVGCSEAISRVTAQVKRVAPSDATVLITGESGTG